MTTRLKDDRIAVRSGWKGRRGQVRLTTAGDTMLGAWTREAFEKRGGDWLFEKVRDDFRNSDLAVLNVECTVSDTGKFDLCTGSSLRAPSKMTRVLTDLGIRAATIANNHIMDEGDAALRQTIINLKTAGIVPFGAGENAAEAWKPAILESNGMKFGFIGFVECFKPTAYAAGRNKPGVADYHAGNVFAEIRKLRKRVDHVVVAGHADLEFYPYPSVDRVRYARKLVDAGAAAVIMHHPHVPQGIEAYHGGLIAYSLGNFMFPSTYHYIHQGGPWTDRSFYLQLDFDRNGVLGATIRPFKTLPAARNQPLSGRERAAFLAHLSEISSKLADTGFLERYTFAVWLHQLWVSAYVANKTARQKGNRQKVTNCVRAVCDTILNCKHSELKKRIARFGYPDLTLIDPDIWLDP